MAYAAFPAPGYLSNAARTEGEMKTALENWLDACQDTQGVGQCRLEYVSTDVLQLTRFDGRVLMISDSSVILPATALQYFNSATGFVANQTYYILMQAGPAFSAIAVGSTTSHTTNINRILHPSTGVQIPTVDSTAYDYYTIVGLAELDAAQHWTRLGLATWFNRRLQSFKVNVGTGSTSSTAYSPLGPNTRVVNWVGGMTLIAVDLVLFATVETDVGLQMNAFDGVNDRIIALTPAHVMPTYTRVNINIPSEYFLDGGQSIGLFIKITGAPATVSWAGDSITFTRVC